MVLRDIIINHGNQTYSHFNCGNWVHHIQMFTNPSLFPAVLFFLPPDPLEQCWATQINTYMNLTFSKPSIGLGGKVSHCFLFTTVQMNAIENLKFVLETENVSTLLSRIVGNTCLPPGISHVVRQRFCCC